MAEDELEQLALWLSLNRRRHNWELIRMLAKEWPDATAAEIHRAWQGMNEIAMRNFEESVDKHKVGPASHVHRRQVAAKRSE